MYKNKDCRIDRGRRELINIFTELEALQKKAHFVEGNIFGKGDSMAIVEDDSVVSYIF